MLGCLSLKKEKTTPVPQRGEPRCDIRPLEMHTCAYERNSDATVLFYPECAFGKCFMIATCNFFGFFYLRMPFVNRVVYQWRKEGAICEEKDEEVE